MGQYGSQRKSRELDGGMCEVGWTDSWRERKVELNITQEMPKIFTKEI